MIGDTRTSLRFPLGLAGGFNDFATGFVRFGFRDYDPQTGRFTAKDPAGDTGGDHDLWDYCVDDPVGRIDPLGLEDRSTWDRFWAWYSPLLFGNDEERNAARDSLHRSLKKEAEALAGGYVDAMTILSVPTSMGTWATESLIDSDRSNDSRENFLRYKNNKEKQICERE